MAERKRLLDIKKSFLKNNTTTKKIENDLKKYLTFHNLIRIKNKTYVIAKFKNKFYITTLTKFETMIKYKSIEPAFFIKIFLNKKCKQCKYFSACKLNFYTKNKNVILKNIIELNNNENYCKTNKKMIQ